jgi:hypothetical protein
MAGLTGYLCPAGGGSWRCGDTWRPWSCPEPGVGARAAGTHGAPRAALSREVGAGAPGTRGAPGATLHREVGAGAAGTLGAPGATPLPLPHPSVYGQGVVVPVTPQIIHIG